MMAKGKSRQRADRAVMVQTESIRAGDRWQRKKAGEKT